MTQAPALPRVLGLEEDGVVRLVPGHPGAHLRERDAVGVDELPAVALLRGGREAPEVGGARRRDVPALGGVRPRRRADDREDDVDVVLDREPHRPVVRVPVVGEVGRVGRAARPARGDPDAGAGPPEIDAEQLRARVRELGEDELGLAVEDGAVVEDPDLQLVRRPGRRREGECEADERGDDERREPMHARGLFPAMPACGAAPRRERSPAPSRAAASPG